MTAPRFLTFSTLDDLAFAAEKGRLDRLPSGLSIVAADLGPIIEFEQLGAAGLLPAPEKAPWLALDGISSLYSALKSGRERWVCPTLRNQGFFRTGVVPLRDEVPWTGFGLAAQQAAVAAGFPNRLAAQLVGAIGEMHSNIYEHSGASETGMVAFKARPGVFEFVLADRGMGVLESLRSASEYASLTDHGEALRLTLTDGVSRYGAGSNRGRGFRPLFIGLANLSGSLRFRSGDHALTIDGQTPSLVTAQTAQKPYLPGLLASVSCRFTSAG